MGAAYALKFFNALVVKCIGVIGLADRDLVCTVCCRPLPLQPPHAIRGKSICVGGLRLVVQKGQGWVPEWGQNGSHSPGLSLVGGMESRWQALYVWREDRAVFGSLSRDIV